MSESLAAAIGFAGVAVGVTALIALHVLPTGLSPMADAVSRYGITKYRVGYRVQTLGYAAAGLALGLGVAHGLHRGSLVVGLLVAFAAARALISWFPMDAPGAPRTEHGRRHGLLALIAFAAVAVAAARLPTVLHRDGVDPGAGNISAVLGWLLLASLLTMVLTRAGGPLAGRFGLVERVFYLLVTAWLVLVAIVLV